jgi:hypothetical protein
VRPEFVKRDPQRHPVRFLAGIWEERTETSLTPKELGQLRDLRKGLGDFTRDVLEWMVVPAHWWRFCQQVKAQSGPGSPATPPLPHVGFLLKHRCRAVNIMRVELRHSTTATHVSLCRRLDKLRYQQLRTLIVVLSDGGPEWLSHIKTAYTVTDLQRVFIQMVDHKTDGST